MIELIDTHCHLYLDDFAGDLDEVIARATDEGVTRIYMPCIDTNHLKSMLDTAAAHKDMCYSMLGLHPCYVRENYREELELLKKAATAQRFVAIGEIGLDYYWDRSYDDQQMTCFREQIDLALHLHLPVVIHSRNSMDACISVLNDYRTKGLTGIFHCFSGSLQNAHDIINCGFKLGIGGVITYKKAGLAEVVAELPLEHLVLETDAPYLTPAPFRGKRNESSYLTYIADKIAEVKKLGRDEVCRVTTANALDVFGR